MDIQYTNINNLILKMNEVLENKEELTIYNIIDECEKNTTDGIFLILEKFNLTNVEFEIDENEICEYCATKFNDSDVIKFDVAIKFITLNFTKKK